MPACVRGAEGTAHDAPAASRPTSLMSTPVQPLPAWLRPYYLELVAGMVAFLLVLLPAAVWLQLYCGDSKRCYPAEEED